jgi:hypothetical protein
MISMKISKNIDEMHIFRLKCIFFVKKVVYVKIYKYVYILKIN